MTNAPTNSPIKRATLEDTPAKCVPFEQLWNPTLHPDYLLSEWWTLLPCNDKVIVGIDRMDTPGNGCCILQCVSAVRRDDLLRKVRRLPDTRWISTVRLILAADNEDHRATSLLHDITKLGTQKGFRVESMIAPETTADYITRFVRTFHA